MVIEILFVISQAVIFRSLLYIPKIELALDAPSTNWQVITPFYNEFHHHSNFEERIILPILIADLISNTPASHQNTRGKNSSPNNSLNKKHLATRKKVAKC